MESNRLAQKLMSNDPVDFRREIKKVNNDKSQISTSINGIVRNKEICSFWSHHYMEIFNCVQSTLDDLNQEKNK